ncbi:hypothetical protein Tco_0621580 [Tanacetum coccineum]
MATSPNDVRVQVIMKIREEMDMEVALEEEMLNLFTRFLERIRLRRSEIIRLGSQPDNPLVDHGRELLERLTGADMRNAMQMMGARHELQRSLAEKAIIPIAIHLELATFLDLLEDTPAPGRSRQYSTSMVMGTLRTILVNELINSTLFEVM